jgi:hypothetical protein
MEEDTSHAEEATPAKQGLPPSNTGHQQGNAREENDRRIATEHFSMGSLAPPLQPISFAVPSTGHTTVASHSPIELSRPYDILAQQGSGATDIDSDILSFGSISGANTSTSGSRCIRGRDPIPLTTEILHLLDRLEPDKGKEARLLKDHLT